MGRDYATGFKGAGVHSWPPKAPTNPHSGFSGRASATADAVNSCPHPVHFPDAILPSLKVTSLRVRFIGDQINYQKYTLKGGRAFAKSALISEKISDKNPAKPLVLQELTSQVTVTAGRELFSEQPQR